MRINAHSKLTADDVYFAVKQARAEYGQDIFLDDITVGKHGAINFYCASQHGKFAVNRHGKSEARAASWVAYGYVIAELYRRDPEAHIGFYNSVEHFRNWCEECRQTYLNREAIGIRNREGDYGSDLSFLALTEA